MLHRTPPRAIKSFEAMAPVYEFFGKYNTWTADKSAEGTFYLLPRSPLADDVAFTNLLAEEQVYCLPGQVVEMPGYFRISLTANDEMIERAIPRFAAVRQRVA